MSPETACDLWRRHRAGETLSDAEQADLAEAMRDEVLRQQVFEDADLEGLLRASAVSAADGSAFVAGCVDAFAAELRGGKRPPIAVRRWRSALPIAVAVAACLAVALVLAPLVRREPAPVAVIRSASAPAAAWRGGHAEPVAPGAELRAGDVVVAGDGELVSAASDGSASLRLEPGAALQIAGDARAKRYGLLRGALDASVDHQPPGSSLRAETDEAVAAIVGTRFRLERTAAGTRLEVREGVVRFSDRRGGTSDVGVGEVATATASAAAEVSGLIARWDFEAAGSPSPDVTGRGHAARWLGGARVAPAPGPAPAAVGAQALELDGRDGRLLIDDAIDLRPSRLTIAAWIRIPAGPWPAAADIFGRGPAGFSLETSAETGGVLFIVHSDHPLGVAALGVGFDRWHHVAGTYDGATLRAYLDGHETQALPCAAGIVHPANGFVVIGSSPSDSSRFFRGAIDDVRVYDRALSAGEIAGLAAGAPDPAGASAAAPAGF